MRPDRTLFYDIICPLALAPGITVAKIRSLGGFVGGVFSTPASVGLGIMMKIPVGRKAPGGSGSTTPLDPRTRLLRIIGVSIGVDSPMLQRRPSLAERLAASRHDRRSKGVMSVPRWDRRTQLLLAAARKRSAA